MIQSFADGATEDIFDGVPSPRARRKLTQLNRVQSLDELRIPPGNRLEPLKGARTGQYSIRVNEQYRICFRWEDGYASEAQITD